MGLLPDDILTSLAGNEELSMNDFSVGLKNLFSTMREGGVYGSFRIRNFDGTLFDSDFIPKLQTGDIKDKLYAAAKQDWTGIDPSIFGTLFERVIDKSKRSQLGLHYTSKDDIMLVIEPVVMNPLRDKWYSLKSEAVSMIQQKQEKEQQEQEKREQQKQDADNKEQDSQEKQNQPKEYKETRKQKFKSVKLSDEDAERVMAELKNRERELQRRLKKQNANPHGTQKDW